jgi:hypothetical protein
MSHSTDGPLRIGILWRGDRMVASPAPRADRQLGHLLDALATHDVIIVMIPYDDDAINVVQEEILGCDGVLVWVNPIQDGANRAILDSLLLHVSDLGVFVSAHPDVILKLGTKEVIVRTRDLGWGSDCELYNSPEDFKERFPARLAEHSRLVLKQGRGNGGDGVWGVTLVGPESGTSAEIVRVQDAQARDGSSEMMNLRDFMDRCDSYFAWSSCLVDQEYQERLADGMLRCYFTHDEVVGFARQWPKGLLPLEPGAPPIDSPHSVMEGPEVPAYQSLRRRVEREWLPQMERVLDLERESLPVIWDADFLYGVRDDEGADTFVLCEINVSAVWPFPSMASVSVADAAVRQSQIARTARAGHPSSS